MSKPDWKDAPEWAMFLAQDKDGEWFWWEGEPAIKETSTPFWRASIVSMDMGKFKYERSARDKKNFNWKDTLESRP